MTWKKGNNYVLIHTSTHVFVIHTCWITINESITRKKT